MITLFVEYSYTVTSEQEYNEMIAMIEGQKTVHDSLRVFENRAELKIKCNLTVSKD
jgi:hypothetical protein